ncbi:hypothetical protein [Pelosinus fermentans]|nr:hypothetical protein [Pelosinus fermentans]
MEIGQEFLYYMVNIDDIKDVYNLEFMGKQLTDIRYVIDLTPTM